MLRGLFYIWSVIFVLVLHPNLSVAQTVSPPKVLVLKNRTNIEKGWNSKHPGILPRELVRQTVLMVAREDFGLSTRDTTLQEPMPKEPDVSVLELDIVAFPTTTGELHLQLFSGADFDQPAFSKTYRFTYGETSTFETLIPVLLRDVVPDIQSTLKSLGVEKQEPPSASDDQSLAGFESLANEISFIGQLEALRIAHREYRRTGKRNWLEAISQAYANLSVLTMEYWNGTSEVFAARSLLYVEKLLMSANSDARSIWFRSYARAMIGMHRAAAKDAVAAKKVETKNEEPKWASFILPYCRFQFAELKQVAAKSGSLQSLAKLMNYRMAASLNDSKIQQTAATELLKDSPLCFQALDPLTFIWYSADVLTGESSFDHVARHLDDRIGKMHDLPATSKTVKKSGGFLGRLFGSDNENPLTKPAARARSLTNLKLSDDLIEPSWGLVGRMIQEELFVRVVDDAHASLNGTDHENKSYMNSLRQIVSGHPYERYLSFLAVNRETSPKDAENVLTSFEPPEPRPNMAYACRLMTHVSTPTHRYFGSELWAQAEKDFTEPRLVQKLRGDEGFNYQGYDYQTMITHLKRISPYSPACVRLQISHNQDPTDEQLAIWKELTAEDPNGVGQLGDLYYRLNRKKDALECYAKAIELSPTADRHITLANAYHIEGEVEEWKATLLAYLNVEDVGLGHAKVQNQLAIGLMAMEKWDEAKPYAELAAETWSAWGMLTASRVYEGLSVWEDSEKWVMEAAQNYAGRTRAQWYLWCRRTGRGDLAGASALMQRFWESPYSTNQSDQYLKGVYLIMEGKPEEALDVFQKTQKYDQSTWSLSHLVFLATQLKKQETLNEGLESLKKTYQQLEATSQTADLAVTKEIVRCLGAEDKPNPNYELIENAIKDADFDVVADACYRIGTLAKLTGDDGKADEYWSRCVRSAALDKFNVTLAGFELAKQYGTSR